MITLIAMILMLIGGLFLMSGSLGVLRYEDVYLRIQFSSKALTFGLSFFLTGIALMTPGSEVTWKVVLAILFQLMTAPIAGTVLAQVAMRNHVKVHGLENKDDLEKEPEI